MEAAISGSDALPQARSARLACGSASEPLIAASIWGSAQGAAPGCRGRAGGRGHATDPVPASVAACANENSGSEPRGLLGSSDAPLPCTAKPLDSCVVVAGGDRPALRADGDEG